MDASTLKDWDVHFLSRFEAADFGLAADGAGGVGRNENNTCNVLTM
jgi:hypothetical protein